MTAVPLLSGVLGSETGEFHLSYPLNLEPVIVNSKISQGQLKAVPGAVILGTGPGTDRGGIAWNGVHYRVMGTKFCSVSATGTVTVIGDVGSGARCKFDYSFDRLGINSGLALYYYDTANGLRQVTDPDLGNVLDMIWVDGYFMTTDGTYVIVTELSDPMSVQPLKYGSAEEDPDPVTGLIKYRDTAYILGRYTIQIFENVGGNGFPFAAVKEQTTVPHGCVSPTAKCLLGDDGFAFAGSGRDEGLNVYISKDGQAVPVGCAELCDAMDALSDPAVIELENRTDRTEHRLMVHLPDQTWVYLVEASKEAQEPVWYRIATNGAYRCRNAVPAYGMNIVGDIETGTIGFLSHTDRLHFGVDPGWSFDCGFLYNQGLGAIVDSVELVGLPGRGGDGAVFMSMTDDGETFSSEKSVVRKAAERTKRIAWRPHRRIKNYLGLRFRGFGSALPGIAACEVKARPLSV
jgi:hypothetical protein